MKRPPVLHWPSVRGRARADAGPLLLTALVVVVVTALAGAVPALLRSTADDAVRDAVRRAGESADVTVTARWEPDAGEHGRVRMPRLAEDVAALRDRSLDELGAGLRDALLPPVAGATTPTLKVTDGSVLRTLRLAYLSRDATPAAGSGATGGTVGPGPAVTWIDGKEPGGTADEADGNVESPTYGPPWRVEIGLSETAAEQLGYRPGDRIPAADERGDKKHVVVSGIFRPADPADPAWRLAPWLLTPANGSDGTGTTRFGGLLSASSLPDARLAFGPDDMRRTIWFSPDPGVLTWESAEQIAGTAVNLKATSASTSSIDTASTWNTQLDTVLRDVRRQIDAASAQAAVLLIAVLAVGVLVLLLAAGLLVRRRTPALAVARQRGAGLPVLGAELLIESFAATLLAVGVGAAIARTLIAAASATPDAAAGIAWTAPVVLAALVAAPALGVAAAAHATRDRRVPANRTARQRLIRTGQLRRAAGEIAILVVTAGAFAALYQRGVTPGAAVALPAAAPTLGMIAGGLALVRLVPVGTGFVLRRALRSTRPLAVFGAARAAERDGRALPLLTVVTAAGLAVFALTAAATVEGGLRDGAWRTVGAEARLDLPQGRESAAPSPSESTPSPSGSTPSSSGSTPSPSGSTPSSSGSTPSSSESAAVEAARAIAARPGVTHVATAQVRPNTRIATDEVSVSPQLVVVDTVAFRSLLAGTPLPDAAALASLPAGSGGAEDAVPALVLSADDRLRPGMKLQLMRAGDRAVPLLAVGVAPPVGGAADVVLVEAGALAAAGMATEPDTVWATGPGAADAVAAVAAGGAGTAVLLENVLRERRDAPLVAGLRQLAWAAAAVMFGLGLLGFALSAAATAPDRWQTLSRLRTIGLRPRDARRVATAELLPLALVAGLAGPLLGLALAAVTLGPLALRLLTGQSADPSPAPPWPALSAVAVVFVLAALVVAPLEARVRRSQRLSEVLRVGA
jgi:putative ABC transport system permease protein